MSSLFLTLVIVPVMYQIFDRLIEKFNGKKEEHTIDELLVASYDHKEVKEYEEEPELV